MSIYRPDLFADQVVLVTGGASGICRGIASGFAAHGAKLAITSRKQERLDEAAAALEAEHSTECLAMASDVRDPEAVKKVVDATIARFGRLDVVINGAAGNFLCPAAQLSANGYRTVLDIDACGSFNVSRAAFDGWMRDNGGQIINISATLQYLGTPLQIHASSAKAAVDVQTRTLAVEWGGLGIRVNSIAPGPIDETEGMSRLAPGGARERLTAKIPMGRFGHVDEIADAALFLASPGASYITGAILVVDGAAWLGSGMFDLM